MGLPMSALVAKAGYAVTAFDRSAARLDEARAQGISIAASPAEAVSGKAAIVTSLPDDAALRGALLGPSRPHRRDGCWICSDRDQHRERRGLRRSRGRRTGARHRLSACAGLRQCQHRPYRCADLLRLGAEGCLRNAKPLFAAFTRAQTYLGPAEEARYAKLAVNLMIAVSAAMMAESLALARKGGIALAGHSEGARR